MPDRTSVLGLPLPTTDVEEAKRQLRTHGCCIIADALSAEEIAHLSQRTLEQAECERLASVASCETGAERAIYDLDAPNQRVWSLLNKGTEYRRLVEHSSVLEIVTSVLGEDLILSSLTANIANRGGKAMPLHMDQSSLPSYIPEPVVCNVAWVISGYTERGGATRIIPGSHRWPYLRADEVPEQLTVPAIAAPGSALIFEGRTWHGTGENLTDEPRIALLAFYSKPWLRAQENSVASISDEVLREASPRLKTLLGFKPWAALGGLDGHNLFGKSHADRNRPFIGRMTHSGSNRSSCKR